MYYVITMKNDSNKIQDEKALTREERAERRKQREQLRRQKRADRIEQAKRTLQEESRPYFIERAKQVLIEEDLAERIDQLRQELKDVRTKHRAKLREIREKERGDRRPVSEKERAKRREPAKRGGLFKRASRHGYQTFIKINRIIEELVGKEASEVFDLMPHDKALILSKVSYGQIADKLNDQEHKTLYGKNWSRASVKRQLGLKGGRKYKGIGHIEKKTKAATNKREKATMEFARKMNEEVIPLIDRTVTHHEIARELNKRGIKTRTGNQWVNSAVTRLFLAIDKLEKE